MGGVLVRVKVEMSGPLQADPEKAQIRTVGESAGSKVPEKLGLDRIGGRKKKRGLGPPLAPSEIRKLGDSSDAAGASGDSGEHAAKAPRPPSTNNRRKRVNIGASGIEVPPAAGGSKRRFTRNGKTY
jgi:hypothetical protein